MTVEINAKKEEKQAEDMKKLNDLLKKTQNDLMKSKERYHKLEADSNGMVKMLEEDKKILNE